jgi:hypothetical protein
MFGAGKILARSATPAPNMGEALLAVLKASHKKCRTGYALLYDVLCPPYLIFLM